jgi:hypothetical protein
METRVMIDLIYVAATILFFALMVAYIAACDWLGRGADVERAGKEQP